MNLRRLAAVALCLVVGAAAFASTASARTLAQARSICPDGSFCLFEHTSWNGKYVSSRYAIHRLSDFGFNDRASSYVNDSGNAFCMREHERSQWSSGGAWIWSSGWGYRASMPQGWNDRVSAVGKMVSAGKIC